MSEKKGTIIKVAGPLVVAKGLEGEKMFNLVRVSKQRLIGEIVALEKDWAYIQVYEETAGLSCGEPVFATGKPLSVELGPGLLNSIYDGIQRPLPLIEEKSGCYIERGVELPALSRQKKWKFTPLVKVGDVLEKGDILGEVPETKDLKQRILVTEIKGKGRVKSIRPGGEYSIEEIIAEIEDEKGGLIQEKMYHTWPVRQKRPFKRKLGLSEIMVTGQRVIDTFFPLMKGGTGCVPGGFGTGKCITGDTPIMLTNGEIKKIEDVYKENKNNGKITKNNYEEYIMLDKPVKVLSYREGKVVKNKISAIYKGKTSKIFQIETRTGRVANITPTHKLFTIDNKLNIKEVESRELKIGQYLILPRKLEIEEKIQEINPLNIYSKERVVDKNILHQTSKIIGELSEKYGGKKELSKKIKINYAVLFEYYSGGNKPTVNFLKRLYKEAGKKLVFSQVKGEHQSKIIKIPKKFDEKFAEFLGLLLADGTLAENTITLFKNDEIILNRFEKLSRDLFGLLPKRDIAKTVRCSRIYSSVLGRLLRYLGYPSFRKSKTGVVPDIVMCSPKRVISKFLAAYFICDGYVGKNGYELEFSTASKEMQSGLCWLLTRLGILNKISSRLVQGFKQYEVIISGRDEVEKFYNFCNLSWSWKFQKIRNYLKENKRGYTALDIVPLASEFIKEIYEKAKKPYSTLMKAGIKITNYTNNQESMSKKTFRKFSEVLGIKNLLKFATNDLEHIYIDKIVEIKEIDKEIDVYDLEVPQTHNFVGGIAPMFYHNTVVQHQLAKWSDAEVIIFVGCGERGNEMTDLLLEFSKLKDPKTGQLLMNRSVLIANTSNMPVAAREASIYTGITIAEYFRDMGYNVALMADSTSRWAEALREIAGRLEEMPGEEGYPTYLPSRTASFYERAGRVRCLGSKEREGSVAAIGAISPPGGDFSEPVTQNTFRVTKVFWELDTSLAYQRHFPAINWLDSYSLYKRKTDDLLKSRVALDWAEINTKAMSILQQEAKLQEIALLVGVESLAEKDKLTLQTAKSIREDFLIQNAFDDVDSFSSLKKQYLILKTIISFHQKIAFLLGEGKKLQEIDKDNVMRERISKLKYVPEEKIQEIEKLIEEIKKLE